MSEEKNWELVSFVKRSDQRRDVLEFLDSPSMPKEISDATNIRQPHVSRALKELKEKSLVKVLNPDAKRGRLYKRTEKGEEILQKIDGGKNVQTVKDREPEYSVAAEGAVLREKTEDLAEENPDYKELNERVKQVVRDWRDGEISAEEAVEEYEKIRSEMDELE